MFRRTNKRRKRRKMRTGKMERSPRKRRTTNEGQSPGGQNRGLGLERGKEETKGSNQVMK